MAEWSKALAWKVSNTPKGVRGFESHPPGGSSRLRFMERWPSGRRRTPGKCVTPNRVRGFESHPLRQMIGKFLAASISRPRQQRSGDNARRVAPKGRGAERRVIPPSPPDDKLYFRR